MNINVNNSTINVILTDETIILNDEMFDISEIKVHVYQDIIFEIREQGLFVNDTYIDMTRVNGTVNILECMSLNATGILLDLIKCLKMGNKVKKRITRIKVLLDNYRHFIDAETVNLANEAIEKYKGLDVDNEINLRSYLLLPRGNSKLKDYGGERVYINSIPDNYVRDEEKMFMKGLVTSHVNRGGHVYDQMNIFLVDLLNYIRNSEIGELLGNGINLVHKGSGVQRYILQNYNPVDLSAFGTSSDNDVSFEVLRGVSIFAFNKLNRFIVEWMKLRRDEIYRATSKYHTEVTANNIIYRPSKDGDKYASGRSYMCTTHEEYPLIIKSTREMFPGLDGEQIDFHLHRYMYSYSVTILDGEYLIRSETKTVAEGLDVTVAWKDHFDENLNTFHIPAY